MEIDLLFVNKIMRNSPQLDVVFSAHKCSIIDRETRLTVAVGLEDHGLWSLPLNNLSRQLVGNLIYLIATRHDISFAVSYISRFMTTPKADHWIAAKHELRYVSGTHDYGLLYTRSSDPTLSGYTDSDWAGSVDVCKSTTGYVFSLGSGAVTWTSKKQQAVALSSTKAEYWGAVKASCEAVWLRRMLGDMHVSQAGPTPLFCGNQGVLKLAKNPVFHE
eukprot:PITA_12337